MKKCMPFFIALALFCTWSSHSAFAQSETANSSEYTTALGLRLGWPAGVTVKHFMSPHNALEGIVGFWYGGINITGLYEYHSPIKGVNGLQWFIGIGADFTSWNYYGYNGASIGIDGIIGLDYKINSVPIDLSLDWKPAFYVTGVSSGLGRSPFYGTGLALSLRYTF